MAVEEINAKGGVSGRQLRIVEFDDQFAAAKGVEAYQWLAGAQHVVAVVGYTGAGAFAAMEQLPRYSVPSSARASGPTVSPTWSARIR